MFARMKLDTVITGTAEISAVSSVNCSEIAAGGARVDRVRITRDLFQLKRTVTHAKDSVFTWRAHQSSCLLFTLT